MMLYIAIILLVELAALPIGANTTGEVHGPTRWQLIGIVWGTTIGLTVAHWFSFQIARHGLRITNLPQSTRDEIFAEVVGAGLLAAIVTIPLLVFPEETADEAVGYVVALTIGAIGYLVERDAGASKRTAIIYGVGAMIAGIVVATVKYKLAFH